MPRRLGQHFLNKVSILERIAEAAVPEPPVSTVIEIGPGKGALTGHLLARCERLIAVELDTVLVHYLRQRFRDAAHFELLNKDVLKTDLTQFGPTIVAGNLPYYITSPIVEKVLNLGPLLERAVFLVQREVAERIAAGPGSRDYGYLSVATQVLCEPELLFVVPPGSFSPPPKVDSAVIRLTPRLQPLTPAVPAFLKFASAAFRQKRKMLRNNLAAEYPSIADAAEGKLRAEQLSTADLIALYQKLAGTA